MVRVGHLWLEFGRQTLVQIRNSKVNYCLGFSACFIVVVTVSVLLSVIGQSPVIFLRLAELKGGEIDVSCSAEQGGIERLNYTLAAELLSAAGGQFGYHTPRIVGDVSTVADWSCGSGLDPYERSWKYDGLGANDTCRSSPGGCFAWYCAGRRYQARLFLIDSAREKRIELGREWPLGPVPAAGSVYVQRSLARSLGVAAGSVLHVVVDARQLLGRPWHDAIELLDAQQQPPDAPADNSSSTLGTDVDLVYVPLLVAAVFSDAGGKFGSDINNALVMELSGFMGWLAEQVNPALNDTRSQPLLRSFELAQYASSVVINLPPPRIVPYLDSNFDNVQASLVKFSANAAYQLGFNQLDIQLPLLTQLSTTQFFGLFLGLILNIVIVILLLLSCMLVYSLLATNVESRTFEMGVLRMLGTTRQALVGLLLLQAFAYSVPAWALGLAIGAVLFVVVAAVLQVLIGTAVSTSLSLDAVLVATALGVLIPLVSAVFPIRSALAKSLHESLDVRRSKTKAVEISINRSEAGSVSVPLVLVGLLLSAFGFGVYLVFPMSLLTMNLALLLNMFFALLLAMLLGCVIVSLNVQHTLEQIVVALLLFWDKLAVTTLVSKNLVAHRRRNRKTAIMFALSLGFIIFISVSFTSTLDSFTYQLQRDNAVLLRVQVPSSSRVQDNSDVISSVRQLEQVVVGNALVASHSWQTKSLRAVVPGLTALAVSSVGHVFAAPHNVYAVSSNYFSTVLPGFLKVKQRLASDDDFTLAEQLYTVDGSKSAVLGSLFSTSLSLSLGGPFLLDATVRNASYSGAVLHRLKAAAFVDSCPGFVMSAFPSATLQDALVSLPSLVRLSGGGLASVDDIPLAALLVRLVDGASNAEFDLVKSQLNGAIGSDTGVSVWDYREAAAPMSSASQLLSLLFDLLTIVALLVSSFSLTSSMYTNVFEQAKEIGVLRSVGISNALLYRIYVFEAFVLVFSSALLGLLIGEANHLLCLLPVSTSTFSLNFSILTG
eukprot:TRINITY_DN2458_c0_g2_i3.p1 TRINITY_DN2458_c0_g2~~TRINITY_DN2458_c0_g2_i3.p1  ORF type:complete len:1000 (-),score=386.52 TRINITY_DN2458_c0_g2_i3:162-3161(-)